MLCQNQCGLLMCLRSNFIHSQNFSAVEIVSEEDSSKENVSKGIYFFVVIAKSI